MTGRASREDERLVEAVETEQRYLSGELHDELCQTLAGVAIRVELMLRAAAKNKPIPVEDFASLKKIVEQGIDQTRAFSKSLNPRAPELGGFGLMTMLQELATERSRHIPCEFKCERPVSIQESHVAHTLFRVAQECCRLDSNDSRIKTIRISLFQEKNRLNLEVRYEGKNLPEKKSLLGNALLHARARSVGGELKLRSEATHVKVLCTVPVSASRSVGTK